MTTIARTIAVTLFLSLGAVGAASAQPAGEMPKLDEMYNSPMRKQCTDELRKDSAWRGSLEKELRIKIHEEDSDLIATNKKHVIMGYSALWIIVVVFLVLTWRKHRALQVEAARLQSEIERLTDSES